MRVIIIGGIAAGMSAAAKLRRIDPSAQILVIEKQDYISFGACGLPYYIGDYFSEKERMLVRKPEQIRAMGIELQLQQEVVAVDVLSKNVTVKNLLDGSQRKENYDKLMIASGASAIIPPIKNLSLENVHMLRTLHDGEKVREKMMSESVRSVGVIGAGFIGLEVVEAAKKLGKEVHLFQLEDRVLKDTFDVEVTNLIEEELRKEGVHLHLNTMVTALDGEQSVTHVRAGEQAYATDLVIVATGVRPNTQFLKETGIAMLPNGAIVIDEQGRTSIDDIYAAGDCATVPHLKKTEPCYIPLATSANKLGRIVGENLAGRELKYPKTLGSSCLKVLGIEAGRTGLTEQDAIKQGVSYKAIFITDKNHTDYYPNQEKIHVKLIYHKDTKVILGGQVVGKSDAVQRTNVLATAITANMTTSMLGMLDLCYAPPFSRTWDVLNIAGNAAK